jgi:O-antigen ligase
MISPAPAARDTPIVLETSTWLVCRVLLFVTFAVLLVSPVETPRIVDAPPALSWTIICLMAAAAVWLPDLIAGGWPATPVNWFIAAYVSAIVFTSVMSVSPWHTLEAALLLAGQLAVFYATVSLARRAPYVAALAVLIVVCGVALLQLLALGYHAELGLLGRPKAYPIPEGWGGYPELGALGAIQLGLVGGGLVTAKRPAQIAAAVGLAVIGVAELILLYSRINIVAAGVVVGLAVLLAALGRNLRRVRLIAATIGLLAVTLVGASPTLRYLVRALVNPTMSRPSDVPTLDLADPSTRLAIWSKTLAMIGDSPWYGAGLGNFRRVFETEYNPELNDDLRHGVHAHNLWLQETAELGVIGGAVFATLWGVIVWRAWRLARLRPTFVTVGLFLAIAGTTVTNLADTVPEMFGGLRIYTLTWVLFGLVEAHAPSSIYRWDTR